MSKKNKEFKNIIADTAKEVYKDGLKEPVKETGKTIALLPRVIKAALAPVEMWILNKEYSIKMTQKMLEAKLQQFDPNQIESPEPYVAVPAINALSYTFASDSLLDMYSNLLASSMIVNKKWKVHPSFVEIIKQLSPDEAKLLKSLALHEGVNEFPLIDLVMEKEKDQYRLEYYYVLRNFTNLGNRVCDLPSNISAYIDNLVRLNLIEIKESATAIGCDYSVLENDKMIVDFMNKNQLKEGFKWGFEHSLFMITSFGKAFISICVLPPKNNNN